MDEMDQRIKEALSGFHETENSGPCPDDFLFADFSSQSLSEAKQAEILDHAAGCATCIARLAAIAEAKTGVWKKEKIKKSILLRAKDIADQARPGILKGREKFRESLKPETEKSGLKQGIMKHCWLLISLTFLGISFFVPRYFIQLIVLTIIFGLKWVFDQATTRQIIMIYEQWKERKDKNPK
jgi:hypothetical protein